MFNITLVFPLNFISTVLDCLILNVIRSFGCNDTIVVPLILLIILALNSLVTFVADCNMSFALTDNVIEHSSFVAPHIKYDTRYIPLSFILIELPSGYSVKNDIPFSSNGIIGSFAYGKLSCVSVIEYLIL